MENFFSEILHYITQHSNIYLYLFLFFSAIIENLFPPIPGDTITAFGAFLVGTGRLNYMLVYFSTTLGSVIGFMTLFITGKYLGKKFFHEKNFKYFSIENIKKTERWIEKYGYWVVLFNRFLPGIRSVISIASGISMLKTFRVFLISLVSALAWNLIWIHTGYLLGNNWEIVKEKMSNIMLKYNIFILIIIALAILVFIIIKNKNKLRSNTKKQ